MPVSASWLSSFARSMIRWSVGNCCDPCRRNSRKIRSRVPNNITRYAPVCGSWKQQRNCWTKCCKSSDGKIDETKNAAKNGLCRRFFWGNTAQSPPDGFARNLRADFRHITQKSLAIRQYACGISRQSAEKSDNAPYAQALCGVALEFYEH